VAIATADEAARLYRQLAELDGAYQAVEPSQAWQGATIDATRWDQVVREMEEARAKATSEDLRRAIEVAMRFAAVTTGAIEGLYEADRGFTFMVATQAIAWQAAAREKGENVLELFEAQLKGYELALDIATRSEPVTEAWIRRLHEVLCGPQEHVPVLTPQGWQNQELLKGEYKRQSNHVLQPDDTWFTYAPVLDTPSEMHRLIDELVSPAFADYHPVVQAAYAHHALSRIHPFQDGNGRVARALASVFLYRAAWVPLVVFVDEKPEYFASLRAADGGERRPFIDFVYERTSDAVHIVTEHLSSALTERVAGLGSLLSTPSGLALAELDELGVRILEAVSAGVIDELKSLQLPPGVYMQAQGSLPGMSGEPAVPKDFRPILGRGNVGVYLSGTVQGAGLTHVQRALRIYVRSDGGATGVFRLLADDSQPLEVSLRDVHPAFRTAFDLRLRAWVRRVLDRVVDEMTSRVRDALKEAGYLGEDQPTRGA
jgi:Fic family protein